MTEFEAFSCWVELVLSNPYETDPDDWYRAMTLLMGERAPA